MHIPLVIYQVIVQEVLVTGCQVVDIGLHIALRRKKYVPR